MKKTKLMLGNNINSLKNLPDNSIDSVVTDPPYGLSFMNKKWDYDVPSVDFWREVLRVLKPGGHVLSFGGTRTYHRMVVNMEDAGFEIRDQIMWVYGSGFPKSLNIGKAVDKINGLEIPKNAMRIVNSVCIDNYDGGGFGRRCDNVNYVAQNQWEGFGTALKPANEPICLARKPLSEKSVAENVLKWGTGGINVDGCRVGSETISVHNAPKGTFAGGDEDRGSDINSYREHEGRFPANLILECCCDDCGGHENPDCPCYIMDGQSVGSSRFFYQAKVSKAERNMGLDGFEDREFYRLDPNQNTPYTEIQKKYAERAPRKNHHPTIKPINLMTYLCRLITPPGGIVLDPFMGSGSTGIASQLEGFRFVGMEMDEEYFKIAEARINSYEKYKKFVK